MAINAINGISVSTSSTINGISGVDEVNGLELSSGGGGYTPAAGNVLWIKADALGLADNDPVATATDYSGVGNNHTQGTSGSRPTYKTAIINGKAIIRGDGIDDVLVHSGQVTTSGSFAMLSVAKKGATNNTYFYFNGDAGSNGYGLGVDGSGNRVVLFGGVTALVGGAMSSNFEVWSVIRDGTTTTLWVDGVEDIVTNPTASIITPSGDSFLVAPTASGNFWDGDVAEVLVWDNDIGETAREEAEDYAGDKYDITITH